MIKSPVAWVIFILIGALSVSIAGAAFYKYQDKNGKIHYVDDISKIPPEYREDLGIYKETQKRLSDEDKLKLQHEEQKQWQKRKQDLYDQIRRRKEAKKQQQENKKRQKLLEKLITNVVIRGNSVLVPVKISYGNKKGTARLILDTGAEIVVLHQNFADQLNIKPFRKSRATVAGGKTIPMGLAKLASIEVGPHKRTDFVAAIIKPVNTMGYDGLLGMNFLRNLEYRVDFDKRIIVWKP